MALPPLELFSLKKRPPCCRVAFSLFRYNFCGIEGRYFLKRKPLKKKYFDLEDKAQRRRCRECQERYAALRRKRHSMSHALHPALQILIALSSLALLIWPTLLVDEDD